MNLNDLIDAVSKHAAIRRRQILQPVGGKGDKIFPPTYPGDGKNAPPRHVFEKRRIADREVWCVLVDSVQSQANRLEESLLDAVRNGVTIPHVVVDFSGSNLAGVTQITSLDAPHRVYDAILRDSLTTGTQPQKFMESENGKKLAAASLKDASALLEISPNALLFGAWHSTGQGGGLGAKFARVLISEIVAIEVPIEEVVNRRTGEVSVSTSGRRTGSRVDPLGVMKDVKIYRSAENENEWTPIEAKAAKDDRGNAILLPTKSGKPGRPSIINHGNVTPNFQQLGITCNHLEHTFVLSFAALRRLRFGGSLEKDAAGRALLAALGLLALTEQDARGYALRSRCDLVCDGASPLELVHADGSVDPKQSVNLDSKTARELYEEAVDVAKKKGFSLSAKTELRPQEKLVEIVRKSQELALSGAGEEGDDDGAGS
ncbi:MAG TPA: type I-U CRISPR-associated RAMP protein Csb1/Cas7u [Steroidobacteraceae bacterium]|nr:type I-U CRISPR-associated RAMP protein Csb1/Cas7u [Steroidobacteraceae bacterium]